MATRLILLCAGATASSRIGAFPSPDEPLDAGGAAKAASYRLPGAVPADVAASPSRAALETAGILGYDAHPEPLLADLDHGRWSGRSLEQVQGSAPERLGAWLSDPTQATPGGERPQDLVARVATWMDARADRSAPMLAVCPIAVMRAALSHALAMPLAATMRVDIAPLTAMILSHHGAWRLQELRRAG